MKFLKENMILVICAAVVVLSIGSVFYPIGSWKEAWQSDVKQYYDRTLGEIQQGTSTTLEIPGSDTKSTGIPTPNWIDAKSNAMKLMADEAKQVTQNGATANKKGRIDDAGIPLLEGKAEPHYLPRMQPGATPDQFKDDYRPIVGKWKVRLIGGNRPGTPPTRSRSG